MKHIGSTAAVLAACLAGAIHVEGNRDLYPCENATPKKTIAITKPKARKGNKYADTRNYK